MIDLPPLPEPTPGILTDQAGWVSQVGHFTESQMRSYGEACARAALEAAATECESVCNKATDSGLSAGAWACSHKVRALKDAP